MPQLSTSPVHFTFLAAMTIVKSPFTFQPGEVILRNLFSDHGSPSMLGNQTLMGIIGLTSNLLAGGLD